MQQITAIGFDLFDTLVTIQNLGLQEAMDRLVNELHTAGIEVEKKTFLPVYRETARSFTTTARLNHKETHNRFWISAALQKTGQNISPDDSRIERVVESYFSAFVEHAVLLPNTLEALTALQRHYCLGLLSNFTHPPVVHQILSHFGLDALLEVQLVSGTIGYRKPDRRVFDALAEAFGVPRDQIAFVGDDLHADIEGAQNAGLRPIHTIYASVYKSSLQSDIPPQPDNNPDPPIWWRPPILSSAREAEAGIESELATIASWDELLALLGRERETI